MSKRTDLAVDVFESLGQKKTRKKEEKKRSGGVKSTKIEIQTKEEEQEFQKPIGTYITVEFPSLLSFTAEEEVEDAIFDAMRLLWKKKDGSVLVAGLGNTDITADSIGPATASRIFATRHIYGETAKKLGLAALQNVAVITPGVLGKTGIETGELIKSAVQTVKPSVVIVVDALATNSIHRLFRTVQLCDSGISPGSGVKNSRKELSEKTLGVPVIAVGVPTVVDADILAEELTGSDVKIANDLIVTPKDADLLCEKISDLLSLSLNRFLQPGIDRELLMEFL